MPFRTKDGTSSAIAERSYTGVPAGAARTSRRCYRQGRYCFAPTVPNNNDVTERAEGRSRKVGVEVASNGTEVGSRPFGEFGRLRDPLDPVRIPGTQLRELEATLGNRGDTAPILWAGPIRSVSLARECIQPEEIRQPPVYGAGKLSAPAVMGGVKPRNTELN